MKPSRDSFVAQARLRYILGSLGAVHFGSEQMDWVGDRLAGHFVEHDGCGNHIAIHWDAGGVVAVAFDHESPESEYAKARKDRQPERHFERAPAELSELVKTVCSSHDRLATDGAWALGDSTASLFTSADGAMFEGYELTPKAAIAIWRPESSLNAKQAALAISLAEKSAAGPYAMREDDAAVILAPPTARGKRPTLENLEQAVALLEKVAITWPGVLDEARSEHGKRSKKRDEALGASGALLRAARAGDVEAAMTAIANGANIDVQMPEGYLDGFARDVTPLILALQLGHGWLARRLIEAGADVGLMTVPVQYGPLYALRVAAQDGQLEICRMLIERGASVRADTSLGVLGHLAEGMGDHSWCGSDADYGEVIRLLLDSGAPLPDVYHCGRLVGLVRATGASDLESRLWPPPKVPVQLPEVPVGPIVDAAAAHATLPELLQRATDDWRRGSTMSALQALDDAWRLTRHPRIADLVDIPLGVGVWYADQPRPRSTQAELDFRRMAGSPPDPRWSRQIVLWLSVRGAGTAEEGERAEDAAAAALIAARDVRMLEPLAAFCTRERFAGAALPLRESLAVALRALQDFSPVSLLEEEAAQVSFLEDVMAGWTPSRGAPSVRQLYRDVYADPKEDESRRRLATRLEELGDPHGEFIQLQLERAKTSGKVTARERELRAEHTNRWLGRIANQIGVEVFHKGFVFRACVGPPGIPAEQTSMGWAWGTRAMGSGSEEEWTTLERLSLWRSIMSGTEQLLAHRHLHGLREIADLPRADMRVLAAGPTRPLRVLEIGWARHKSYYDFRAYEGLLAKIFSLTPDLEEARFPARKLTLQRIEAMTADLKQLRRISVGVEEGRSFAELVDFAQRRGLEGVAALGVYDLAMDVPSASMDLRFPSINFHDDMSAAVAAEIEKLKPKRLVIRRPVGASIEERGEGSAPVLLRHGERLDLEPLFDAAASAGATCAIEPDPIHWSRSPARDS